MSKSCRLPDEEEVVNWFASLALRLRSDPLPTQELWSAQIERLRSAIAALRRERDNARIGRDDLRILAIYDRVLHNLAGSEIREAQLRERAEAAEQKLKMAHMGNCDCHDASNAPHPKRPAFLGHEGTFMDCRNHQHPFVDEGCATLRECGLEESDGEDGEGD